MLRRIYSCILCLLTPVLLLRLWWKGRRLPAYRKGIAERFGRNTLTTTDIWLHAVSLGEVVAATPLLEAFLAKGYQIRVTTMTPTGLQQLQKTFGKRLAYQYVPYDLPWLAKRFFRKLKPSLALIMETELWPNLIHYASSEKIPLYLLNARLSDRSFQQYQKMAFFFRPLLQKFSGIFAQSPEDAQRFIALGAPESGVQALGNLKFEGPKQRVNPEKFYPLRQAWGEKRPVFIAASTHNDEEGQVLARLKKMQSAIPDILLVIAPRHPERFQEVYQLAQNSGFSTALRSEEKAISKDKEILILDSLGELGSFYSLCHYAFVGGSLVNIGGHNVLEPLAAEIPVFTGMHMQNSKGICRDLTAASALQMLPDADALIDALVYTHQNPAYKKTLLENAAKMLKSGQGVLQRYIEKLDIPDKETH